MSHSMQSSNESHLLETAQPPKFASATTSAEPLPPATALNDRLLSEHTDVPVDDTSCGANLVRNVCYLVGLVLTPRQVLGIIRVLKAVTFCFLVLNILSNGMYIIFVHIMGTHAVKLMAGGARDTVIRAYGLGLCFLALAVEVDVSKIVKKFSGLKGFIPRALFMFLIASITSSHPIYDKSVYKAQQAYFNQQQYNYNNNNGGGGDDDNANQYNNNYDDANNGGGDDSYSYWTPYDPSSEIPSSAVNFQLVTSFVLYVPVVLSRARRLRHFPLMVLTLAFLCRSLRSASLSFNRALCAAGYLFCGLLCLDRFTTRAFLATKDPRITTAIGGAGYGSNPPPQQPDQYP
jgi:hypothetical protein